MERKTQVLIIGAGPTGLTLACELARRNISIRIIDRAPEFPIGSRGKGLTPRSLEVMADLGLAEQITAAGATDIIFRRFKDSQWLEDIKPETFARTDTRYPKGVLIPQWKVEEILRTKLHSLGVEVQRGSELISFSQTKDHVSAVVKQVRPEKSAGSENPAGSKKSAGSEKPAGSENPAGSEKSAGPESSSAPKQEGTAEQEVIDCTYMIGCDGGKSTVRKTLGIPFQGETHEEERAYIGDVEVDGLTPDAWHIWNHPQLGFGFGLCPFACSSGWQVQTAALPDANGQLAEPGLETFQRLFAERTGMKDVTLKNATWASLYRVNIRMADSFRSGRVFLAGDAAHVHSIAGGLGMNTGIQDAYNLGWKLAQVLNDQADEHLLDTYEEERLPIAAWTLNISSEKHRAVTEAIKKGGDGGLHNVGARDTTQLDLNYRYSSLSRNLTTDQNAIQAGHRAPDLHLPDGRWLSDLYRGTHFTVLRSGKKTQPIPTRNVRYFNLPSVFGRTDATYVIRPDGYIGLVVNATGHTAVNATGHTAVIATDHTAANATGQTADNATDQVAANAAAEAADEAAVNDYLRLYLPNEITG